MGPKWQVEGLARRGQEAPLLVKSIIAAGVMTWIPALHASFDAQHPIAQTFFYAGLLIIIFGVMLALGLDRPGRRERTQSQLFALFGMYLVLPLIYALPLWLLLPETAALDLWFEMLSSFTTTGASVFEGRVLAPSLHLWRALVGWAGGFLVLVAAWAILTPLNLGGSEVLSGLTPGQSLRQTGRSFGESLTFGAGRGTALQNPSLRLALAVRTIFPIYGTLTLLAWLALVICGAESHTALIYAMGALSSSGITDGTPHLGKMTGVAGEAVLLGFLTLALCRRLMPTDLPGLNQAALLYQGAGRTKISQDPELRLALAIILTATATLLLRHIMAESGENSLAALTRAFWGTAFTLTSFLTTTGYESIWWREAQAWAGLRDPGLLLMGLAIIGGGVGTTAGGVTLLRILALWRHGQRELEKAIYPHSVTSGALRRQLAEKGAWFAWVFFMLYAVSVLGVVAALTTLGTKFTEALVLAVAALSTTGPLAAVALENPLAYAPLSGAVKIVLGAAMILGRLETLALIALFAPAQWRR